VNERCRFGIKKQRHNKFIPLAKFAFKTIKKTTSLHLLPFTASPLFLYNYCNLTCIVMAFNMNKSQLKQFRKAKLVNCMNDLTKKSSNTSLHLQILSQNIAYIIAQRTSFFAVTICTCTVYVHTAYVCTYEHLHILYSVSTYMSELIIT
jgi:hypothetical protein